MSSTKKLTQEFINEEYAKKGYEVISEYKNATTKLFVKDKEGYICSSKWSTFNQGAIPIRFSKNNSYTIQNIQHFLDLNTEGYKILSTEYKNVTSDLLFMCSKHHMFYSSLHEIKQGNRCPICAGKQITLETCIATTDSWMVKYFVNKEDAYTHRSQSGDKVSVVCPHCGKEKEMIIGNIYKRKGIGCVCGDGVSYPEKFIISILNQLHIKYIKEYKPEWSNNKRYDFYLENYNCIIETHGEQHYRDNTRFSKYSKKTLEYEQENDQYKKDLALDNNIKCYVVLDCRKSTLEYIKNSILNSKLNNLFDLSNIDWLKCEAEALSNKVKEVCDYWYLHNEVHNEGLTTNDVSKVFNLSRTTIIDYLHKGTKLEWCNYDNTKGIQKKNKGGKPVEIFKNGNSLGVFPSCAELERESKELFGVKLNYKNISKVCNGERKHHKGFTFRYTNIKK